MNYLFWKSKNAESFEWGIGLGVGDRKYSLYSMKIIMTMESPHKTWKPVLPAHEWCEGTSHLPCGNTNREPAESQPEDLCSKRKREKKRGCYMHVCCVMQWPDHVKCVINLVCLANKENVCYVDVSGIVCVIYILRNDEKIDHCKKWSEDKRDNHRTDEGIVIHLLILWQRETETIW